MVTMCEVIGCCGRDGMSCHTLRHCILASVPMYRCVLMRVSVILYVGDVSVVTLLSVYENATHPCSYIVKAESRHGCGCTPDCNDKYCGTDGCFGYCPESSMGFCPTGYFCTDAQMCT